VESKSLFDTFRGNFKGLLFGRRFSLNIESFLSLNTIAAMTISCLNEFLIGVGVLIVIELRRFFADDIVELATNSL
jgi:hypothetical protein